MHIHCSNMIGVFSDNFFDMNPDEVREIEFIPKKKLIKDRSDLKFLLRSFGDLVDK